MTAQQLEKAARILKAIAHPLRLQIIHLLAQHEELPVGELAERSGCEQSLVSHHLTNLKLNGIVKARREGKQTLHALKEREVLRILDCVENCRPNGAF